MFLAVGFPLFGLSLRGYWLGERAGMALSQEGFYGESISGIAKTGLEMGALGAKRVVLRGKVTKLRSA